MPALQVGGGRAERQEEKVLADIERHGWHVIWIRAADGIPGWAFTVGLTHSFGVPELAAFGLSDEVGYTTLNMMGELVREGDRLEPGSRVGHVLEGYDLELRAGDAAWSDALFGSAQWFYRRREPAFVQCVWPDMSGRPLPLGAGVRGAPAAVPARAVDVAGGVSHRPVAGLVVRDDLASPSPGQRLVLASKRVASGEAPVLGVQVFDAGDWVFLDDDSLLDDVVLSHLHHLLEDDPTLEETAGFEPGTVAWRAAPAEPWSVSPVDD